MNETCEVEVGELDTETEQDIESVTESEWEADPGEEGSEGTSISKPLPVVQRMDEHPLPSHFRTRAMFLSLFFLLPLSPFLFSPCPLSFSLLISVPSPFKMAFIFAFILSFQASKTSLFFSPSFLSPSPTPLPFPSIFFLQLSAHDTPFRTSDCQSLPHPPPFCFSVHFPSRNCLCPTLSLPIGPCFSHCFS